MRIHPYSKAALRAPQLLVRAEFYLHLAFGRKLASVSFTRASGRPCEGGFVSRGLKHGLYCILQWLCSNLQHERGAALKLKRRGLFVMAALYARPAYLGPL